MSTGTMLRETLARLLLLTGIPRFVRRRTRDRVGILLYHDPSPEVLDLHLGYLRKHYIDDGDASNHQLLGP